MEKGLKKWVGLLVLGIALGIVPGTQAAEETQKIGAVLALSGTGASHGEQMGSGILVWEEQVNARGGIDGTKIKIITCDHKAQAKEGVNCASKFISLDKVPFMFSSYSTVTLSLMPIAEKNKVFVLNGGGTSPTLVGASPYLYNNMVNDSVGLRINANYAFDTMHLKKLALYCWNEDSGRWMAKNAPIVWEKKGGQVVESQFVSVGQVDVRAQVSKIKAANPEVVIMAMTGNDIPVALNEMVRQGLTCLKMGFSHWEIPEVLKISKGASEGIVFATPLWDAKNPLNPAAKDFILGYQKKYGKDPAMYSATFYEGGMVLEQTLRYLHQQKKEVTGENIKNAIETIKTFDSIFGKVTFRKGGEVIKPMALKTVKDGQFTTLRTLSDQELKAVIE